MKDKIIEKIRKAKEEDIKLYLCGVIHYPTVYQLISLPEVVRVVKPDITLLEGRTPDSTYFLGKAVGKFVNELTDTEPHSSPSLKEIKEDIDSIGCLVRGLDLADDEDKRLKKKCKIETARTIATYNKLRDRAQKLLDEAPKKLSASEYLKMEELCDRLYKFEPRGNDSDPIDDLDLFELSEGDLNPIDDLDLDLCEPLGKDSDSVNDFMSNYDKLSSIVDSFPELQKNFKGTVRDLRKLGISKERYLEERETQIFNNTMAQYDGEKRILICIGSSHILDSSPLIKLIEEEGIPHLKFINYLKE